AAGSASCAISSTSLAFGQYVPSHSKPSDFTATLTLVCTASANAPVVGTIALLGMNGASGRALSDGSHRLRYQLFLDAGRTIMWGDGTGDSRTESISETVGRSATLRRNFTIYGRILARQSDVIVGNYVDGITAVLDY
ncbi:MAG: spore coat protein, partial [Alphaproteobacteria bacterium]|nr:spore coat protein [Alphaproteobacteria bacterium]